MEHTDPKGKDILKETLNSVALNPGRARVNPLRWVSTNPGPFFKQIFGLLIGYFLTAKVHWLFFPILLGVIAWIVIYWFNVRTTFKIGAVLPGKVIHLNPDRIAVATDLSKGFGHFPVIKIVELNLLPEDKELNKIIPTISGYNNNPHGYPFWSEFHPSPINHGITNKEKVASYMNTISDTEITDIDDRLQKIHNINLPNTYRVDLDTTGWKDYKELEVGSLSNLRGPKQIEKFESEKDGLELKVQQVWKYKTREIEKNSTVQIVKIENVGGNEVIHLRINDVHFKKDINTPSTVHHIPMDKEVFKNSITKLTGYKKVDASYEDGYMQWREAFESGKGGIFTIGISEVMETLDQVMPES